MSNLIRKSLLAGLLISLAGILYLLSGKGIVGALLFSVGLISVITLKADLFTGKIGYVEDKKTLKDSLLILLFNIVAAVVIGLIYRVTFNPIDIEFKLALPWYSFVFGSVITGSCVYLAVENNKRTGYVSSVVIPVMAFILIGGDHCIADAFFFTASKQIANIGNFGNIVLRFILSIVGNALGAILIHQLSKETKIKNIIEI